MTDFMALFKIFGPYQFVKNLFAKIILKKKPQNPWELGLHFKKIILFVSISRIMNLNVRHIPGIKDAKNMF
jgi:hypothetical protein